MLLPYIIITYIMLSDGYGAKMLFTFREVLNFREPFRRFVLMPARGYFYDDAISPDELLRGHANS